jgi:hypothetical protein
MCAFNKPLLNFESQLQKLNLMKKIYFFGAAILAMAGTLEVSAQAARQSMGALEPVSPYTSEISTFTGTRHSERSGQRDEVEYYSEDFSNGLSGQDGAWSTAGSLADYWFQAFPDYAPLEQLGDGTTVYGPFLANYFGTRTPIESATRDNGFMMIDGDRYNSTRTLVDEPLGPNTTSNPFTAELISPIIDLSGAETTGAELIYHTYQRLCCSGYFLGLSWSLDGGTSWTEPLDVFAPQAGNADFDSEEVYCLNDTVLGNPNLSQFRFKYVWEGSQSHYFWMLDDIRISSSAENDIVIRDTYFDRHQETFEDIEATYEDYFATFEYEIRPEYLVKPMQFGARVDNLCSQNTQTGVQVRAIVTAPDGSVQEILSDPVELTTPSSVLLYSNPTLLNAWSGGMASGNYSVTYEVIQIEEDSRPENNIGGNRVFAVGNDEGNEGFAVTQNGGLTYNGAFNQAWITQNALINTPYVFAEPTSGSSVITHVEVVFLNALDFAETVPGEVIFFNLRQGVPFNDDDNDPATLASTALFGTDNFLYSDAELEYVIEETDLWNSTDPLPQTWTSFELPSPVLIEAGQVYSPEIRISAGIEGGIVFVPISSTNQEQQAFWWRNFSPNGAGVSNVWTTGAGLIAPSIRLRTNSIVNVEQVTYESGVKITQNWPNPFVTESQFMYQLDKTDRVAFEVRDITGKLVFSDDLGTIAAGAVMTHVINRNALSAGIYTYSIVTSDNVVSRKMVVQ